MNAGFGVFARYKHTDETISPLMLSLIHIYLDNEFEKFKRGILKVKDYLFTFLSNPSEMCIRDRPSRNYSAPLWA